MVEHAEKEENRAEREERTEQREERERKRDTYFLGTYVSLTMLDGASTLSASLLSGSTCLA